MKILPDADNPLLSNRTFASQARESEKEIIRLKIAPVDLRTVPRDRWPEYTDRHLALPPRLLDGFEPGPIPPESIAALEDAVAAFHGITPPYSVQMTDALAETGHGWRYDRAAGAFLTGFFLDATEARMSRRTISLRKDETP